MRAILLVLSLLLLNGCAWMAEMIQEKSPAEVYGQAPDTPVACTLLRASRCSYSIEDTGKFNEAGDSYPACAPGWQRKEAFADGGKHVNAVLVALTDQAVVVSYRGTLTLQSEPNPKKVIADWMEDADKTTVVEEGVPGRVHRGFLTAVTSTWEPVVSTLRKWRDEGLLAGRSLYVTGHSKGGAAASIAAMKLKAAGFMPTAVYTFASARPGDAEFVAAMKASGVPVWRYENRYDVVPHLPPNSSEGRLFAILLDVAGVNEHQEYREPGNLLYVNWLGRFTAAYKSLADDRLARFQERLQKPGVLSAVVAAHSSGAGGQYDSAVCAGMRP
jgi:hypothetical protein